MISLEALRIHAFIRGLAPVDAGGWVSLELKLEHRNNIQGECCLRIWHSDSKSYHIGQELCGVPGKSPCTENSLRINAHVNRISEPFDDFQWVEIRLRLDERSDIDGECRFRLWTHESVGCKVGDEVCYVFTPVG